MQINKSLRQAQLVALVEQYQANEFSHLADSQIQHLLSIKEHQASISKHEQSSQYLDSSSRAQSYGEYDAATGKPNQFKGLDANTSIADVIEWNASVQRSKERLFRRQRAKQKQEIKTILKEIEAFSQNENQQLSRTKLTGKLANQIRQYEKQISNRMPKRPVQIKISNRRNEKLTFKWEDVSKLSPGQDLNDTIIENYLKIVRLMFLSELEQSRLHIFSTYLIPKLIGENSEFLNSQLPNKLPRNQIQDIKKKVQENYLSKIKRWTKNVDIFEKELLIFPINAFNHWFCVMVLNPGNIINEQYPTEFIYCDSMFEKRDVIIQIIKEYLRQELSEKKNKFIKPFEEKVYSYQLLLPRQTNTHDCGLYMLAYIDQLLQKGYEQLKMFKYVKNRYQLKLFPRLLIFTMRQRLFHLIENLSFATSQQHIKNICEDFIREKKEIIRQNSQDSSFDQLDSEQFRKYKETIFYQYDSENLPKQQLYLCTQIRFYLDAQVNYYEKDNTTE